MAKGLFSAGVEERWFSFSTLLSVLFPFFSLLTHFFLLLLSQLRVRVLPVNHRWTGVCPPCVSLYFPFFFFQTLPHPLIWGCCLPDDPHGKSHSSRASLINIHPPYLRLPNPPIFIWLSFQQQQQSWLCVFCYFYFEKPPPPSFLPLKNYNGSRNQQQPKAKSNNFFTSNSTRSSNLFPPSHFGVLANSDITW